MRIKRGLRTLRGTPSRLTRGRRYSIRTFNCKYYIGWQRAKGRRRKFPREMLREGSDHEYNRISVYFTIILWINEGKIVNITKHFGTTKPNLSALTTCSVIFKIPSLIYPWNNDKRYKKCHYMSGFPNFQQHFTKKFPPCRHDSW